ncbi:MAG: restriction endonuclease subunit S [Christensenellales bacterium]
MTPQELKSSILQLAIQGKLVEQRPEEGTANDLLDSLPKLKKTAEPFDDENIPFEIPESWTWVHLNQIAESSLGKTMDKAKNTGTPQPYLCSINVYWDGVSLEKVKEALFEESELSKYLLQKGDLLICEGGDVGRCAIWDRDEVMYYQNALHRVRFYGEIVPSFYLYVLHLYKGIGIINEYCKGVTIKHLVQNALYAMPLPLPPVAEQKRIVAKIEELLPYIDHYEKAWNRLEDFNRRFPADMQKSILQMAIQGKLVEQRPEEGTGEELYRQIQAEKQALIKAGKIKKEKPLPEIAEDEVPFEIPEGWKWVRLSQIISVLGDGIHGTPAFDEIGDYYFVNGNNLAKGHIVFKADTKKVSFNEYEKHKKPLDMNTILISINGTIGNYAFYAGEPIILGKSACYFSVLAGVNKEYICHLINTKFFMDYAVKEATQTTIKNVSLKVMRMLPVPLPPLAEQKRIVARLEEILPLCERLK